MGEACLGVTWCLCEGVGVEDLELADCEERCDTNWLNAYTSGAKLDCAWDRTLDSLILLVEFSSEILPPTDCLIHLMMSQNASEAWI